MSQISEVLRLRQDLKMSLRDISKILKISASTVHDYIKRAKVAELTWPLPEGMLENDIYEVLFLPIPSNQQFKALPDWEKVNIELRRKSVTLMLLWKEYNEANLNCLSYSQFCRAYANYKSSIVCFMRQHHKAGEVTFIDYAGMTVPWMNITTNEVLYAQIFVGTLGASQYTFIEATPSQQISDWLQSHMNMFEFFGGVTTTIVPDNLKSGVTKAHLYDAEINKNYQYFCEHYGIAIVPARAVKPKDKAKVEGGVGHISRQILAALRDVTFTSISEINAAIKPRLIELNKRNFQKMRTSRLEIFETIEQPALKPLPHDRYEYSQWSKAKVNFDYHISYAENFYSVPYQYIGKCIDISANTRTIELFFQEKRIATHVVKMSGRYQYVTLMEHMPQSHCEHAKWTPERITRWAEKIGPNTVLFIESVIAARAFPEQAFRACVGIIRLAQRFTPERLEKACIIAYKAGATRYKNIESILKNKLDLVSDAEFTLDVTPQVKHENIRGSNYYK